MTCLCCNYHVKGFTVQGQKLCHLCSHSPMEAVYEEERRHARVGMYVPQDPTMVNVMRMLAYCTNALLENKDETDKRD